MSPQPPALTRDATVWELGLANLFVAKNTQTISQQRITDTRLDASRCGVVAQTIGELDTSPYFAQIQAALADIQQQAAAQLVRLEFDFDSWLDTLKGKLGDDPATALQAQVDDLQAAAGGLPLELSAGSNSVQITADENRLESVKVAGFTTQTGSGDPSKDNVRPVKNAGTRNKLMTVTGDTEGLFMSTIIANKAVVFVKDAMPTQSPLCDRYRSNSATATDKTCWIDQNRNFGVTDSRFTSLEEARRILNEEPVTFAYQSTQDTGAYYTGVAVQQNGADRCDIIRLADRLHAGDTLETNVLYNGELKRVETHVKATVTVDGQTTLFTQGTNGYTVALSGAADGAVLCNAFSGLSASSQSVTIPASAFPASVTSLETANTWAQSQNVVIEYPLSTPEVYADTPVTIDNPQGTYTVSSEESTTLTVAISAPVGRINGKSGASVTLTKADIGLSNVDNTPDAQKNVKGLAVEETDVITGLPTGLYHYKVNTPDAPDTQDGLLLALRYALFGAQLAFPTDGGIYFRWAVNNWSEWARLDQKTT